jgi:hypothetical protein
MKCLPPGYRSSGGIGKGSAYLQNPDQVVEMGKGVFSSRIRIKWWELEVRECIPPESGSSGETGKGVLSHCLPPGSGLIGGTGYIGSAYLQDPD